MPFVLIQTKGYTAMQTALATLPIALCLVLLSRYGAMLAQRIGMTTVLTVGPMIVAAGFVLIAIFADRNDYFTAIFPGFVVLGLGMSATVAPLTTAVIDAAGSGAVGIASAVNTAVARIAALLAIAAAAIGIVVLFNASLDRRLAAMHATPAQRAQIDAQRSTLAGASYADSSLNAATRVAYDRAFSGVAAGCAALALGAGLVNLAGTRPTERRSAT